MLKPDGLPDPSPGFRGTLGHQRLYVEKGAKEAIDYLEAPAHFVLAVTGLKLSDLGNAASAVRGIKEIFKRLDLMKAIVRNVDDLIAFGKLCQNFGDRAVDVLNSVRRISDDTANFGPEAAEKALRALSEVADEPVVVDALKASAKLDECVEGLAVVAKTGLGPEAVSAVLKNHQNILSAAYTAEHLLSDVKQLGAIPGLDHLWKMLKTGNVQAKGFRYELEGAAWLSRSGEEVIGFSHKVDVALGETDIDVVVLQGGLEIYYQFKRSKKALGGLDEAKMWVAKALLELRAGSDYGRVRYAVPPGVKLPTRIDQWFRSLKPPIQVTPIPHKD